MVGFEKAVVDLHQQLYVDRIQPPSFRQIDVSLWAACRNTSINPALIGQEIGFIDMGLALTKHIAEGSLEIIGALSSSGTCSFRPKITAEEIISTFGFGERWEKLEHEHTSHYYQMRFAMNYWLSVRDIAAYSKVHCAHFFCLDKTVVDMIADSSTSNVIDFCNANPNLHRFVLTCRAEDCEEIISIVNDKTLTHRQRKHALSIAQMRKELHSCIFAMAN